MNMYPPPPPAFSSRDESLPPNNKSSHSKHRPVQGYQPHRFDANQMSHSQLLSEHESRILADYPSKVNSGKSSIANHPPAPGHAALPREFYSTNISGTQSLRHHPPTSRSTFTVAPSTFNSYSQAMDFPSNHAQPMSRSYLKFESPANVWNEVPSNRRHAWSHWFGFDVEMKSIYFSCFSGWGSMEVYVDFFSFVVSDMEWLVVLLGLLLYIGNENSLSSSLHRVEIYRAKKSNCQRSACLIIFFFFFVFCLPIKCSVNSKETSSRSDKQKNIILDLEDLSWSEEKRRRWSLDHRKLNAEGRCDVLCRYLFRILTSAISICVK